MNNVKEFFVTREQVSETVRSLQTFGRQRCEGLVLWLGKIDGHSCTVETVMTPPQNSIKSEDGVGYFITSQTLLALNMHLSKTGLRLLAQVHSHPQDAYHSSADDRYCIVTQEGGFSIVVPTFGFGATDLYGWAVYRLSRGMWQKLSRDAVKTMFPGHGEGKSSPKGGGALTKFLKLLS